MKITIEPSYEATPSAHPYPSAYYDTNTNEDNTRDAVEAAFQVLVCAGHHWQNVVEAAETICHEIRSVNGTCTENKEL
jgi:hypothetical protein